jgi:2-hydroxycyclohexanecarboxyl-CoA dehydrogenase
MNESPSKKAQHRSFEDKVVVITGAGSGIGRAAAERFAAAGARVGLFDRNGEAAAVAARAITEAGGAALGVVCDITDRAAIDRGLAELTAAFGPPDVLVNNAGWDLFKPFLDTTPEDWQRIIAINLVGALNMLHAVLPVMVARRSGHVVSVASDAARVGSSGEAVYAACKAGLIALSKTLAREHARHNINFNVVCPGPTDTPLLAAVTEGARDPARLREAFRSAIPMGRFAEPADIAAAILFLASDEAAYITGQVLSVSGGLTMCG